MRNTPSHSASENTIAFWLKEILKEVNVDTKIFKAHSFRSATATKAVLTGASILEVKKQAKWSLSSDTFEKYYFKSNNQHSINAGIVQKLTTTEKDVV